MPFVQRQVQPKYIARRSSTSKSRTTQLQDNELETITNLTLSNAMRQLASVLALSKEIFSELSTELDGINERSTRLKGKLVKIQSRVDAPTYDAKLVVVREYSISLYFLLFSCAAWVFMCSYAQLRRCSFSVNCKSTGKLIFPTISVGVKYHRVLLLHVLCFCWTTLECLEKTLKLFITCRRLDSHLTQLINHIKIHYKKSPHT